MLCGLVMFLPGFFNIPAIDRDEARFAQATKQMVESGDFVDIRFQDDVRYKKPVGIYWLQAAIVESASVLGLPRAQVRPRLPRDPRSVHDRVSFKPIAILLLVPVILATSILTAAVLAPPFAAAGFGVNEIRSRLDALGADFTRIPRFPRALDDLRRGRLAFSTRVYLDNREIVPLSAISPNARQAVLAIEDSDFFEHGALDWSSLIRAMIQNARAGHVVQGGSTITQQLVGSTLGANRFDQSIEGKLQELALSIRVEQQYSKAQIFELYLNQVYMGNGVYGFGTAAQFYFRKPARRLTLLEGATLAGMVRAPEYYDPLDRPEEDVAPPQRRAQPDGGAGLDLGGAQRPPEGEAVAPARERGEAASPASSVLREVPHRPDRAERIRRVRRARPHREGAETGPLRGWSRDPHDARAAMAGLGRAGCATAPQRVGIYPPAGSPPPDVSIVTIDNRSGAVKVILSGRNYREGRARPGDHRPPARVGLQAVRPRRGVPTGHPPDADLLELFTVVLADVG